ncbi:BlaI/MecI/CopY family transcriptional regulator [Belliella sp. DSM 111904]|uniref:BlaI/MecI/CopY family transcriptional regulator n=1 Tax=Belliella filtrata TaxID=2923435 RepID=A0ABS9UX81_9BACT|nr:BlaI/MecI/CopY family transcriptional regulator [Belliella filtrata]MCH7408752.1 BlaI/MecI/CopY family transcriptional regulator [Belliella filtrata]
MKVKPTESELEILQIIWQKREASVREVHEQLAESKDTGYTTTLKQMQIMHTKGLLIRNEESRTHIYSAGIDEQDTQRHLLRNFVSTTFGGSSKNLVMQALGQGTPSKEELTEIRAFLDQLENEK